MSDLNESSPRRSRIRRVIQETHNEALQTQPQDSSHDSISPATVVAAALIFADGKTMRFRTAPELDSQRKKKEGSKMDSFHG